MDQGDSAGALLSWQPPVAPSRSNSTRGSSPARAEARDASRPDDEIIEDALSGYLLERLLDKTQRRSDLSEEEATRLAVEELHAMRRERDAAA